MLEVKVAEVLTGRRLEGGTTSTPERRSPFMLEVAVERDVVVVVVAMGVALLVLLLVPLPAAAVEVVPRVRPLDMAGGDPGPEAAPPAFGAARHPLPVTLPPPAPPTPPTTPP